eukprot:scaffold2636_cov340-Pavlova_lutheri.AAC.58
MDWMLLSSASILYLSYIATFSASSNHRARTALDSLMQAQEPAVSAGVRAQFYELPAVAFEALLITLLCGIGKQSFAGSVAGQAQAWLSGRGQLFSPKGKVAIYHSAAKGRFFCSTGNATKDRDTSWRKVLSHQVDHPALAHVNWPPTRGGRAFVWEAFLPGCGLLLYYSTW